MLLKNYSKALACGFSCLHAEGARSNSALYLAELGEESRGNYPAAKFKMMKGRLGLS